MLSTVMRKTKRTEVKKLADEAHRKAVKLQLKGERIFLGPYASHSLRTDAKHMCFVLSRYKFCAKLLEGKKSVLEIGCGDGTGLPIVAQSVGHVYATDWDRNIIEDNRMRLFFLANCSFLEFDIATGPFTKIMDGVYLLDVVEHLEPSMERTVMQNIVSSVSHSGICIIGTPNIEASRYASPQSQAGHINLKDYKGLRKMMEDYFANVFLFSMNDEVVHTGFYPMAHYLFGVGVGKKTVRSA